MFITVNSLFGSACLLFGSAYLLFSGTYSSVCMVVVCCSLTLFYPPSQLVMIMKFENNSTTSVRGLQFMR